MKDYIRLSDKAIIILSIILSLFIIVVDIFTPTGINTSLLYLIVTFLSLSSEKLRIAFFFAISSSLLNFIGLFISLDNGTMIEGVVNRALVFCAIWTILLIGIRFKRIQEKMWILAAMIESAEDAIIGKDSKGKIIYWNKGAEKLYGYAAEDIIGQSIETLFPEEVRGEENQYLMKLQKGKILKNYDSIRQKKDGTKINVSIRLSLIKSFAGKFIGASTISRDITKQKKREEEKNKELNELQERIEKQFAQSLLLESKILEKTKELKEKEEKLHEVIKECGRSEQKFEYAREEADELENEIEIKNQELALRNEQLESEIEGHRKTEQNLRESESRLKELGAYLTSVREQERATMAREVHDELGQLLTAIKMDLSWFEDYAFDGEKEKYLKRIEDTNNLIDATIASVQRIVSQLRPSILDDLGIVEAIKWQAKEFEKRSKIKCDVNIKSNGIELTGDASTAVFRIFQESLTNIARHSQATEVDIDIENDNEQLALEIRDNGKGLTKEKLNDAKSFGLMGMRERAEMFSGRINFESQEGAGTKVKVLIPINNKVAIND